MPDFTEDLIRAFEEYQSCLAFEGTDLFVLVAA